MPREGSAGPRASDRDQAASAFTQALERLCQSLPAIAAALVDGEGETVDYAGALSPFEVRITAAEWQIVLSRLRECASRGFASADKLLVRSQRGSFCIVGLADGYALIVRLPLGAFSASERAWNEAIREVCAEAGLLVPAAYRGQPWTRVLVDDDRSGRHRPRSLRYAGEWHGLVILGRYHGRELMPRELGYRVRLDNGLETNLIRERFGRWFSDHPVLEPDQVAESPRGNPAVGAR